MNVSLTPQVRREASDKGISVQDYLHQTLQGMSEAAGQRHLAALTADFHVWPDFHGNRCPLANPNLRGMMSGLTLGMASREDLALSLDQNVCLLFLSLVFSLLLFSSSSISIISA